MLPGAVHNGSLLVAHGAAQSYTGMMSEWVSSPAVTVLLKALLLNCSASQWHHTCSRAQVGGHAPDRPLRHTTDPIFNLEFDYRLEIIRPPCGPSVLEQGVIIERVRERQRIEFPELVRRAPRVCRDRSRPPCLLRKGHRMYAAYGRALIQFAPVVPTSGYDRCVNATSSPISMM